MKAKRGNSVYFNVQDINFILMEEGRILYEYVWKNNNLYVRHRDMEVHLIGNKLGSSLREVVAYFKGKHAEIYPNLLFSDDKIHIDKLLVIEELLK